MDGGFVGPLQHVQADLQETERVARQLYGALALLEQLREIPSERAFVSSLEKQLKDHEKRRVDWLAQLQ